MPKRPNLDWEPGCYEPAVERIAQTIADESVLMTPHQLATRIMNDLADINITVEFIDGPKSTT